MLDILSSMSLVNIIKKDDFGKIAGNIAFRNQEDTV